MTKKITTRYMLVASPVHQEPVLLAFTQGSSNVKTGDMSQIFILHPDDAPHIISKRGEDDRVCGSCNLRHSLGGACYVTLFQGPRAVFQGWVNTGKREDSLEDVVELIKGRRVRFGAYGDPVHIPAEIAIRIMQEAHSWTAYTHAWRNPAASFWKGKAMASCDVASHLRTAEKKGWSGFLATASILEGVDVCDNEENGTSCEDCMKCDGSKGSVQLAPHGTRLRKHPSFK